MKVLFWDKNKITSTLIIIIIVICNVIMPGSGFLYLKYKVTAYLYMPIVLLSAIIMYSSELNCCGALNFYLWIYSSYAWLIVVALSTIHLIVVMIQGTYVIESEISKSTTILIYIVVLFVFIDRGHYRIIEIKTESMNKTVLYGEGVLSDFSWYELNDASRGDLIIVSKYSFGKEVFLIRRVIGVHGDMICFFKDINKHPYVVKYNEECIGNIYNVLQDQYFISADNIAKIFDSPWHGVGPVNKVDIRAKVLGIAVSGTLSRMGVVVK